MVTSISNPTFYDPVICDFRVRVSITAVALARFFLVITSAASGVCLLTLDLTSFS